jgi:hypothetical protein
MEKRNGIMARFQPIDDSYDASSNTRLGTASEKNCRSSGKRLGLYGKGDGGRLPG